MNLVYHEHLFLSQGHLDIKKFTQGLRLPPSLWGGASVRYTRKTIKGISKLLMGLGMASCQMFKLFPGFLPMGCHVCSVICRLLHR